MKVLIISDIHGNSDALNAVINSCGDWDYLWVLGDLVDYGPEPHVVVDVIKELRPDVIVMGNHDHAVAFNTDCKCAPELHELSEYTRNEISYRLLSRDQITWLSTLPMVYSGLYDNLRVYVVHGSPRNPLYGYLKPTLPLSELRLSLTASIVAVSPKPIDVDLVVTGHTHIPMDIKINSMRVLNPGSVGQPRDGDPRASYMVVDLNNLEVELRRAKYDINKVISKLRSLNLDVRYFVWLEKILTEGGV